MRNVVYQTSGSFTCQSCLTANPMISDYKIQAGSSAQNMASQSFLVARDIEGTKRPQGSVADIGAFELVSGAAASAPIASLTAAPSEIEGGQAANAVPGIVEGEDYDHGGEGVAYHDTTTGNKGGEYRADDVDIKATTLDPGHTIGWGATGEWLEWTIDVRAVGSYRISAYTGTNDTTNPRLTLSIDGVPVGTAT
jgi:hypothetical protein